MTARHIARSARTVPGPTVRGSWLGVLATLAALTAVTAAAVEPAVAAVSSAPLPGLATNGDVNAILPLGDKVYLGGDFTRIGPVTGLGAAISPTTGLPDLTMPRVSGRYAKVWAVAPDGAGGWYVGGNFDHVGGLPRENLAHINADKTVDADWHPSIEGGPYVLNGVNQILVGPTGTVYVVGSFDTVAGQPRAHLAAIDPLTGQPTSWNPDPDGTITRVAISDHGTMYITGGFSRIGTNQAPRNRLAELDLTTGAATPWNPALVRPTYIAPVAVGPDGLVYVGGQFATIGANNASRTDLAALDPVTGNATAWNPNVNGGTPDAAVHAIAFSPNGTVYAGGQFSSIGANQATRRDLAALDPVTGNATGWNPSPATKCRIWTTFINGLVVAPDGTVYVGGFFDTLGPSQQVRHHLAALDPITGEATAWDPEPYEAVRTIALAADGTVYAGGEFNAMGGERRSAAAALRSNDGTLTDWNPRLVNGTGECARPYVEALAGAADGSLYIAGDFDHAGTNAAARANIVRLDLTTGDATAWSPQLDGIVSHVAVGSAGTVYVAGGFSHAGGSSRDFGLAALNGATAAVEPWNPASGGGLTDPLLQTRPTINVLKVGPDGNVYVGGKFAKLGGQQRANVAALDPTTGQATAWNPGATGDTPQGTNGTAEVNAFAFAPDGATVYMGGAFLTTGANNVVRSHLAEISLTTGNATTWNPAPDGRVEALALDSDGTVYAGGNFGRFLAGFDTATGETTSFWPQPFGGVSRMAFGDGRLYTAGWFTTMRYEAAQNFAVFGPAAPAANTTAPAIAGTPAIGQQLACRNDTWSGHQPHWFVYAWLRDGTPIGGATSDTYTVDSADGGHQLACHVIATNADGTDTATSAPVSIPAPPTGGGGGGSGGGGESSGTGSSSGQNSDGGSTPPVDGGAASPPVAGSAPAPEPDPRPGIHPSSSAVAVVSSARLIERHGRVRVRVRCRSTTSCLGRATLELSDPRRLVVPAATRRGSERLASSGFRIRAGAARWLTLRLTRRAHRMLTRRRQLHATLRLITQRPVGPGAAQPIVIAARR